MSQCICKLQNVVLTLRNHVPRDNYTEQVTWKRCLLYFTESMMSSNMRLPYTIRLLIYFIYYKVRKMRPLNYDIFTSLKNFVFVTCYVLGLLFIQRCFYYSCCHDLQQYSIIVWTASLLYLSDLRENIFITSLLVVSLLQNFYKKAFHVKFSFIPIMQGSLSL